MGDGWHIIKGLAYLGLGAFSFSQGLKVSRERMGGLGYAGSGTRLPEQRLRTLPGEDQWMGDALRRADGVLQKASLHIVRNLNERVAFIQRAIYDPADAERAKRGLKPKSGSLQPEINAAARAVVSRKCHTTTGGVRWCTTPKDYEAEIVAIFTAVQEAKSPIALRYVRDHAYVDQFTAAKKLIRVRGGDCDDGTILLGSLLMSIGYTIRLRVIQDTQASTWSHIYLLVGMPPQQGQNARRWIPLDWSVYPFQRAGWQAPGADSVALDGRAAGVVTRVRDFKV
jgi:hypothetical protein